MIFGAILAGGTGTRMQMKDLPKQFLLLGEKPVIIHTLETFLRCERVEKVYIGVHESWLSYMEDLVSQYITDRVGDVVCISGGQDRNGTIMNVIAAIETAYGVCDEHYILTHDAVRPFVTQKILEDNISSVLQYKACNTVIPATDTIVESDDGKSVSGIPVRSRLYQGQTPQSFQITLLKQCYEKLTEQEKAVLTDASKICLIGGIPVSLVQGDPINMKITTQVDYQIARAVVAYKE